MSEGTDKRAHINDEGGLTTTMRAEEEGKNRCSVLIVSQVKNLKEIKGPVGIREVSYDSRCIVVENMSDKSEFDLSGWRLERTFGSDQEADQDKRRITVTLPTGTYLERKSRINIWAGYVDNVREDLRADVIFQHLRDWGKASVQVTKLYDQNNELKAIHKKNVIY